MVVDDVEDDADASLVRPINETSHVVRRTIMMEGCEQLHAVVSPAPPPGKLIHRHDLEACDPEVFQVAKMLRGSRPGSRLREGADVHLVEHLPFRADAGPVIVSPTESTRVHDFGRPVHSIRLIARHRIRIGMNIIVQLKVVTAPARRLARSPRNIRAGPARVLRRRGPSHRTRPSPAGVWGPDAEVNASAAIKQLGAHRQPRCGVRLS